MKIESAQYRLMTNPTKINRYIGKRAMWYYQEKYSTKTGQNCAADRDVVDSELTTLKGHYATFYDDMMNIVSQMARTLKYEHDDFVKQINANLASAITSEPDEPTYTKCPDRPTKPSVLDYKGSDDPKYIAAMDAYKSTYRTYSNCVSANNKLKSDW